MNNAKQVIVMRKDLGMRKGKMVAQGAHASIAWLTKGLTDVPEFHYPKTAKMIWLSEAQLAWINGIFTKVCVGVDSEEELVAIHESALAADVTSHLITDAGLTEFNGVPTKTCCGIGPDYSELIDKITGHLKLL